VGLIDVSNIEGVGLIGSYSIQTYRHKDIQTYRHTHTNTTYLDGVGGFFEVVYVTERDVDR
jgi:hypothetical protein